jgi:hypothetical protein
MVFIEIPAKNDEFLFKIKNKIVLGFLDGF